ncbi:MAG TPA: Gfo/Idh/MocA family oxidoreductase [Candidatus Polarisedimenticolaceae bacterium]|nr:Gfo/Idh/MocA family oxidoreductase [Candidatus Polarisedimenticolaceae bacterium]
MTARRVRVGVVGVGHLGRHHARLYASLEAAELVAVVDRDAERAAEVAARCGCVAYTDAAELLGRVEAASVAVPTLYHRAVAVPLLEGGVDVLVEKPLAGTLEAADAINRAAEANDRMVMVGHSERFNPALQALARAVDAPRFFEIHRLAAFSARSTDVDVVLDLMIHDLDLLLYLDGTEPTAVHAVGVAALTDKIDIANARIHLESGCVANLTASRISAESVRRVRVFQSRTYLSCDTAARKVERYRLSRGADGAPRIEREQLPVAEGEPLALELDAFLQAVRDRTAPPVDGRQGRRALELAHRVRDAIASSAAPP